MIERVAPTQRIGALWNRPDNAASDGERRTLSCFFEAIADGFYIIEFFGSSATISINAVLNHGHIEHGMELLTKRLALGELRRRVATRLLTPESQPNR